MVEFHRLGDSLENAVGKPESVGVRLPSLAGLWQPRPVEYKRGRPKFGPYDEIQLCAQALCLEELLGVSIPAGDLFYGEPRQRSTVAFNADLRAQTEGLAARLHDLTRSGKTPLARYEKKCDSCSLFSICLPKTLGKSPSVEDYLLGEGKFVRTETSEN